MGRARNIALWEKFTDTEFYSENFKVGDNLRHQDANRRIKLKWILKEQNVRSGSGQGPVTCPCAHGDELQIL
jgi:hypothetical protein